MSNCEDYACSRKAYKATHVCQAILIRSLESGEADIVDLDHAKELDHERRKLLLDRAMETEDMDNEKFLEKVKARMDR